MKRRQLIFALFTLLGLLGTLLLTRLEVVWEDEPVPPSPEAQRNRFLAAQRVLAELGIDSRDIRGRPDEIPLDRPAILFWPSWSGTPSRLTANRLERFVEAGGHLVIESQYGGGALQDRFGIHRLELRADACDESDDDYEGFVDGDDAPELTQGDDGAVGDDEPVEGGIEGDEIATGPHGAESAAADDECGAASAVGDPPRYLLTGTALGGPSLRIDVQVIAGLATTQRPTAIVGPPDRAFMLQIERGLGRVTVFDTLLIFNNQRIDDADHAELLHRLVLQAGTDADVLFMRRLPGGFGDWLVEKAWRPLLALAALVLLALWAGIPRFGPVLPDPPAARRRLLDHLRASGRLLWKHGERGALASAAADAALRRVRSEFPHTHGLDEAALTRFLRQRLGVDPSLAALLLNPRSAHQVPSFIALLRVCRDIHRQLSPRRELRPASPLYDE